jgi:tetratricopeptide (TPR) repeat protein
VARWARPGGVSNHQELLPELDNLAAACRRAIARGDAAVAAATCSAAGDWLVFRGPVSTLVELAESVLALPGVSLAGRRRVAALLATAHLNAGRLADAAGAHSLALGLAEREGNAVARAYLHGRIAWRLQLEGRGEEATAELARAEAVARRHPAPEVEVVALREIGGVHWLAGRLPEARRVFERVIPLARRLGDERTEAFCTGNLGLVAVYLGDRRSARTHFERALVALARHGDRRNAALIHVNMGLVLHESGQLREARTQYQYALAELGQVGDERGRAMAASNLGYVLHELGECTAARELLEDTLTATRRASDLPTELLTLANLGLLQWDLGDADGAAPRVGRDARAVHPDGPGEVLPQPVGVVDRGLAAAGHREERAARGGERGRRAAHPHHLRELRPVEAVERRHALVAEHRAQQRSSPAPGGDGRSGDRRRQRARSRASSSSTVATSMRPPGQSVAMRVTAR